MKSSAIIVATLLSALTLPVFAQTGAAATPATAPATTTVAPKATTTTKHKMVKHIAKKDVTGKTSSTTTAAKPAATATPVKS